MSPEERVGAAVREWLTAQGWTCYAEVEVPAAGKRRADLVATRPASLCLRVPDVLIVEAKTRLTFDLIGQASEWRGFGHFVSVATETGPKGRGFDAALMLLRKCGLGWFVMKDGVRQLLAPDPDMLARRAGILLDALRPEHRESAPGNARSEYFTATDEQRRALRALVDGEREAMPLVDVLRAVLDKTPDAATRRAWAKAIRMGQVPGVRSEGSGRRVVLLPDDVTAKGTF